MAQQQQQKDTQPDKGVAANGKPSQAEGDRQTVEDDLKEKENEKNARPKNANARN